MNALRLLSPWTWIKVLASAVALCVNAIQLSEVADDDGEPLPRKRDQYLQRARLVAFEAGQIRHHLGAQPRRV